MPLFQGTLIKNLNAARPKILVASDPAADPPTATDPTEPTTGPLRTFILEQGKANMPLSKFVLQRSKDKGPIMSRFIDPVQAADALAQAELAKTVPPPASGSRYGYQGLIRRPTRTSGLASSKLVTAESASPARSLSRTPQLVTEE